MGQASGLLMWVTGPHKPGAASVGGLSSLQPTFGGVVGSPIAKNRLRLAFGGPNVINSAAIRAISP